MEIRSLLKKIREEHNYSVARMGEIIGAAGSLVNQIETGRRNVTEKYINKVIKAFPVYGKEVMESFYLGKVKEITKEIKDREIPLKNIKVDISEVEIPLFTASAGNGLLVMDEEEETIKLTLPREIQKIKNIFAIRVSGDSMLPEYRPNDILIADPNMVCNYEDLNNENVIVEVNDERYIKCLKFEDYMPYLYSYNQVYAPIKINGSDEIKIIGVAVYLIRKMSKKYSY